jgi:hypothetical protein
LHEAKIYFRLLLRQFSLGESLKMRLKTLRTVIAVFAAAAAFPIMTPVEARVFLTECERQAWNECVDELGYGRITDPEFAICYETKREAYCPKPQEPPFPGPIPDCTTWPVPRICLPPQP